MSGKPNVKTVQFIMCRPLPVVRSSSLLTGRLGGGYTLSFKGEAQSYKTCIYQNSAGM